MPARKGDKERKNGQREGERRDGETLRQTGGKKLTETKRRRYTVPERKRDGERINGQRKGVGRGGEREEMEKYVERRFASQYGNTTQTATQRTKERTKKELREIGV